MAARQVGVVLDSSVWISYFDTLDSNHKKAETILAAVATRTVVVTEYVLLEVATVLKRNIGQTQTANIIATLLQVENVVLLESTQFFQPTLELFLSLQDKLLSFVDVSLLVLAKDFEVITFDTKLAKVLAGRIVS